jgi:hypothetical protein
MLSGSVDIGNVFFQDHQKVSDLIYYEGPILSHFVDSFGTNYLYYWVDYTQEANKWLVFRTNKKDLVLFLNGKKSLNDLFNNELNSLVFTVDITPDLEYKNLALQNPLNIDPSYIPESTTYFTSIIPPVYQQMITDLEPDFYVTLLRENALYLKLESTTAKFNRTLSVQEISEFLSNILLSFKGYVEYNFFLKFQTKYHNFESLKNAISKIRENLTPRAVDLEFSSFIIGFNADVIARDVDPDISEWKKHVVPNYKKDVITLDYSSPAEVELKLNQIPPTSRRKIYDPIIKIVNSKTYNLSFSSVQKKSYTPVKKISNETVAKIDFIQPVSPEKVDDKRLIHAVLEIGKNEKLSDLRKKEIIDGILFSEEVDDFTFKVDKVDTVKYVFQLNTMIESKISFSNGVYTLVNEDLQIYVVGKSKEEYTRKFAADFQILYENNLNESTRNVQTWEVFNSLIDTITNKS